MAEYIEYFSIEDLTSILVDHLDKDDEFYEYDHKDRLKTCEFLHEVFNFAFHSILTLFMEDGNEDNAIATVHAFNRTKAILIREESLLFFNDLLHEYFFKDVIVDADGNYADEIVDADGNYMVSLRHFIQDEEKLGRIFSVCAIAYAWNVEYWEMKSKGIDSKEGNIRRIKKLENNYRKDVDKEVFLRDYKRIETKNMKRMQRILFKPALNELLVNNPYKNEIIQELETRIIHRKY